MFRFFFLIFIILPSSSIFAQVTVDTVYYKDQFQTKIESKKKAKYYKVTSLSADSVIIEYHFVKPHQLIGKDVFNTEGTNGTRSIYHYTGRIISKVKYAKNECEQYEINESDSIKLSPDFMEKLLHHQKNNIKYPFEAVEGGYEGTVYVNIKLDKTGKVEVLSIAKGVHWSLDSEVIRVFNSFINNSPATLNGMPIEACFTLPVKFKLQ